MIFGFHFLYEQTNKQMSFSLDCSPGSSWTKKYNPKTIKDFIGNINVIKDAARYLKNFKCEQSPRADFPKAILISGPTGTGKTEFAKLLALYRGFIPIEFSAALLRKKKEVQHCIDVYKSDIRRNYSANHPFVIQALNNLDSCNMGRLGVGKAIIIDELDATSKGYKGLLGSLMNILKSSKGHNPKTIIIMTCDESTLNTKLKTIKNQCYNLKFKKISDREMIKLINRVSENEHLILKDEDKRQFVKFSNGDCRRLLNGMEMCFKNGTGEYTPTELSRMVQSFIENDNDTIQRLKYSTLSSEKILRKVISCSICKAPEESTFDIIPFVQGDMYALGAQLYKTYPTLIRKDINPVHQMEMLSAAMDEISYADHFMDRIRESSGYDDGYSYSDYFIIQGVVNPLYKMQKGIPKNFKLDVVGYAKIYGLNKTIDSQNSIKTKIGHMVPELFGQPIDVIRYFGSSLAKQLQDGKYTEVAEYFHKHDIDPSVIDELEKIRLLPFGDRKSEPRYFGVELKDVWKSATKRKFKKQFVVDKPLVQGVKFKDEKKGKKILFFEKFNKPPKKNRKIDY